MNEKVKALLRRIVFQLRDAIEGDEFALEDLSDGLASSEVTPEELAAAFGGEGGSGGDHGEFPGIH